MQIVTAGEMYEMDRYAMEMVGIEGKILMENAGRALAARISSFIRRPGLVLVLAGGGNNGGDGFVIARALRDEGVQAEILQAVPDEKISGDAFYHKQLFLHVGGKIQHLANVRDLNYLFGEAEVIVDALLGIGIKGAVRGPFTQVIDAVNASDTITVSVDIPSGVPAEEGIAAFTAIQADYTLIVEEPKISAFLQSCTPFYGTWEVVKIGIPPQARSSVPLRQIWGWEETKATLPRRKPLSHKGSHGKGLIVGGSREMPGAAAMTAAAALRAGSGLVTVGTLAEIIPSILAHCPEATFRTMAGEEGFLDSQEINTSPYDAVAVGMGMGRGKETQELTRKLLNQTDAPVLVDADGLYHLKADLSLLQHRAHPVVLTPHPGEMAMLMDCRVEDILLSPFAVSRDFARTHQVYLVLKGPFTIVTDPEGRQWVNSSGNAGLAKGGSGDVLSGILLAMLMQPQSVREALSNGCFIHGKSADFLIRNKHAQEELLAFDTIQGLGAVFRALSDQGEADGIQNITDK